MENTYIVASIGLPLKLDGSHLPGSSCDTIGTRMGRMALNYIYDTPTPTAPVIPDDSQQPCVMWLEKIKPFDDGTTAGRTIHPVSSTNQKRFIPTLFLKTTGQVNGFRVGVGTSQYLDAAGGVIISR